MRFSDIMAQENRVEAVERALTILNCFTPERDELELRDLAKATGLYKSTILRLTGSLERFGYLQRSADGVYRLGPTLWRLGALYQQGFALAEVIRPVLRRLSEESGESASFYVREGAVRICLFRHNSSQAVRHHVDEGQQLPLDRGAAGHVLRAFTGSEDPALSEVAKTGAAASQGERDPNTASIAVAVTATDGSFLGALAISGLANRFDAEAQARALEMATQAAADLRPLLPSALD
ncbi:MAG: IclR family transcriptional regulator [Pseudomonadota bacterium]